MKYEIEIYLETVQGYEDEIVALKDKYFQIYKGIKHTFPSRDCSKIIDLYTFKNDEPKHNLGPFTLKFICLLGEIRKASDEKAGIKEEIDFWRK